MSRLITYSCAHCGNIAQQATGAVNRARSNGLNLYCGRACSGLGRRKGKTETQKKAEKAAYDVVYREQNLPKIKAEKRKRHLLTYDPTQAAIARQANMARHVEYCRRPEYREKQKPYWRKRHAIKFYGPFAEAFLMLRDVEREVTSRASDYEIRMMNETLNKTQKRKRQYAQATGDQYGYSR